MPFNREWSKYTGEYAINRERTGQPPPPSTGTTQAADGSIVADSTDITIPPPKIIPVTMPGPRVKPVNSNGDMNPHWYRFLSELYRRTGLYEDNINGTTSRDLGLSSAGAVSIASTAPSILVGMTVPVASVSIVGAAPTIVVA